MRNWSTDTRALNGEAYTIWKLEQLVNFGLDGERIDRAVLKAHLPQLNIDRARRLFLELLLNAPPDSH